MFRVAGCGFKAQEFRLQVSVSVYVSRGGGVCFVLFSLLLEPAAGSVLPGVDLVDSRVADFALRRRVLDRFALHTKDKKIHAEMFNAKTKK